MSIFKKCCCDCCGKKDAADTEEETEVAESVLMIEDPFGRTRLVEKAPESAPEPEPEPEKAEERKPLATRKHLKTKKKQVERIAITGAVAALPPPPAAEVEGPVPRVKDAHGGLNLGDGVYLVYSLEDNGSLYLQYAHARPSCMDGVLGYIRPSREIINYHYESNGGKHVVSTNVTQYMRSKFQHDRKKYFEAWQEFLQVLNAYGGSLYLLAAFKMSPPPRNRLVLFANNSLRELEACTEVRVGEGDLLGVFPHSLDYRSKLVRGVNRKDFGELCEKYGVGFQLIK